MNKAQVLRRDFVRDLAALLRKHEADIDLRTVGGFDSYQQIDLNIDCCTFEFGNLLNAESLDNLAEDMSR